MLFRRNKIWWYDFSFRSERIRGSTYSRSVTVAREAERQRRRDLERGIHNITEVQQNRIRPLADTAEDYLADYWLRYRGSAKLWVTSPKKCSESLRLEQISAQS